MTPPTHSSPAQPPTPSRLGAAPAFLQWALLFALSLLFYLGLELAGLPAAALVGPMLAGVIAGTNGATIRIPLWLFAGSQAVVGVLIAGSIELEVLQAFLADWPIFLAGVLSTVAASSYLGWQISRWKILPGSTAIWGSAPGAATAMVLMAGAFGADFRLVAFMQYLRVMIVAMFAAVIAAFLVGEDAATAHAPLFPALDWPSFLAAAGVAVIGGGVGRLLRLPSPFFLGAMIVGIAVHIGLGVAFQLPPWLLIAAYALIGWSIGLNFTRDIVSHAARALPQVLGSILLLVAFCAGIGFALSRLLGIDFLTAYLATSPGGMDAVAIIAAASANVNMSFVMAMQMARFLFVLLFGPMIARMLAGGARRAGSD